MPAIDQERLRFVPPNDSSRRILSGNTWKSNEPRDQREITDLLELIAGHLASRTDAFVIFHFDGDRPYASQHSAENPKKFQTKIIARIRQLLSLPRRKGGRQKQDASEATVEATDDLLSRLIVFTPYYAIEAWTYYNTALLRRLCRDHEVPKIEEWEKHLERIEEIEQIDKQLSSVGKDHNRTLAEQSFPARRATEVGKSFADTVHALKANQQLMVALSQLRRDASWTMEE